MTIRFLVFLLITLPAVAEIIPLDRRVTWEGNVGLEDYSVTNRSTIFANVLVDIPGTNILATGDGTTDDHTAVSTAVALCPSNQVVYLPTGTYNFAGKRLDIGYNKSITLRGDGMTNTTIKGELRMLGAGGVLDTHTIIAGATNGSTNLILGDVPATLRVGWLFRLDAQGDTNNLVNRFGYEGTWPARPQGQIVRLLSAANSTNWTIEPPLFYDAVTNVVVIRRYSSSTLQNYVRFSGIENLTVVGGGSTDYTVQMQYTDNCWISNVEVTNGRTAAFHLSNAYRSEVKSCYAHDSALNGSGGGYGILLQLKSTGCLVQDNIIQRHAGSILVDDGSVGNVVAYNFSWDFKYFDAGWIPPAFGNHSCHSMFNLWEGNVGPGFFGDFIHGSSSHQTLFRCRYTGVVNESTNTRQMFAVNFDSWNRFGNVVGSVLGVVGVATNYMQRRSAGVFSFAAPVIYSMEYSGSDTVAFPPDTLATETVYLHGNWDAINQGTVWAATNADHTLPDSLYLTGKPDWFGTLAYPPMDGSTGETNIIPAQARWLGIDYQGPQAPYPTSAIINGNVRVRGRVTIGP